MAMPVSAPRAHGWRLCLGFGAAVLAVWVGLSGIPAAADGPDLAPGWDSRHHKTWAGGAPAYYGYGPHGYYRHRQVACGTNAVLGAAFGAGVGGLIGSQLSDRPEDDGGTTVLGILVGAVLGGVLGQSADRANGCN